MPVLHWVALLFLAQAFWQVRSPAEWTRVEAQSLLVASPWAKGAPYQGKLEAATVPVVLLSAKPVQQAIDRIAQTSVEPSLGQDLEPEYRVMLQEKPGAYIMLGVTLPDPEAAMTERDSADLERQTQLHIGKRKYKVEAVFPPTRRIPWMILVFRRDVQPGDKALRFEVYVPGKGNPFHSVDFKLADLIYQGQPEF